MIEMQRRGTETDRADCAREIAATNTRLSFAAARREVTGARQRLAAPKPTRKNAERIHGHADRTG
ncbi:MAG TPA: hypothetical protein VL049_04595, partial [Candidatus Dormibacteraeota bacterium]|nr:hypothetical protein [Candidatus Dormibacteraeota bacterium]